MKFCSYCDKLSYTSKVLVDGSMKYYCDEHAKYISVDQNMKKRFIGLFMLIATAILSGVALNKFLKWAGQEEIFDFDLDEDIDNDQL